MSKNITNVAICEIALFTNLQGKDEEVKKEIGFVYVGLNHLDPLPIAHKLAHARIFPEIHLLVSDIKKEFENDEGPLVFKTDTLKGVADMTKDDRACILKPIEASTKSIIDLHLSQGQNPR